MDANFKVRKTVCLSVTLECVGFQCLALLLRKEIALLRVF